MSEGVNSIKLKCLLSRIFFNCTCTAHISASGLFFCLNVPFFGPPLTWTIDCTELLSSSKSWKQCERRRVPQKEIHVWTLAEWEVSRVANGTR